MGYEESSRGTGTSRRGSRRTRRRERRPLRMLVVGIGVLALVGVIALGGYAFYLQRTVENNLEREDLNATQDSVVTISPDTFGGTQPGDDDSTDDDLDDSGLEGDGDIDEDAPPIVGEDGQPIEVTQSEFSATTPARPESSGEAMNFLIVGTDSRDLSQERGRSDVIVLMHISDERDRVDLIHFPRDLFVPIPGTGGSSKINAAYSYGGAPLLVQTLQPLIDVPIDHVVLVNFESFRAMTDAVGGVDVQVAEASPGFPQGVMHMDGDTGLEFVRERYALSQGDISRGQRQQAFIKGIMQKALSSETLTNPARVARFVDAATTNLTVDADLEVGRMRDLGFAMRSVRGDDIHFETAPWTGISDHPVAGSIVLLADDQMASLSAHLREDTMESYVDEVSPRQGFGG